MSRLDGGDIAVFLVEDALVIRRVTGHAPMFGGPHWIHTQTDRDPEDRQLFLAEQLYGRVLFVR